MPFCPLLQRLGSPVRADGIATMSPDQGEGVFGALGWAGDRAKALAVPYYAGPVTERTNGLVLARSWGTKPTMPFESYWVSSGMRKRILKERSDLWYIESTKIRPELMILLIWFCMNFTPMLYYYGKSFFLYSVTVAWNVTWRVHTVIVNFFERMPRILTPRN